MATVPDNCNVWIVALELSAECIHVSGAAVYGFGDGHMELILAWFLINSWLWTVMVESGSSSPRRLDENSLWKTWALPSCWPRVWCEGASMQIPGFSLSLEASLGCALSPGAGAGLAELSAVDLPWHLGKPGPAPVQAGEQRVVLRGWAVSYSLLTRFMETLFKKHSCVPSAFSTSDKKL